MKEEVYKIIKETINKKNAVNFVLDVEFEKIMTNEIICAIKDLFKENRIYFSRTVNNNYIELRNPNTSRPPVILHDLPEIYKNTKKAIFIYDK